MMLRSVLLLASAATAFVAPALQEKPHVDESRKLDFAAYVASIAKEESSGTRESLTRAELLRRLHSCSEGSMDDADGMHEGDVVVCRPGGEQCLHSLAASRSASASAHAAAMPSSRGSAPELWIATTFVCGLVHHLSRS